MELLSKLYVCCNIPGVYILTLFNGPAYTIVVYHSVSYCIIKIDLNILCYVKVQICNYIYFKYGPTIISNFNSIFPSAGYFKKGCPCMRKRALSIPETPEYEDISSDDSVIPAGQG